MINEMTEGYPKQGKTLDTQERWVFTFGFGHVDPKTGDPLGNCYVVIDGTFDEARATMRRHFGYQWSMQYANEHEAGVGIFALTRIDLPSDPAPERQLQCDNCLTIVPASEIESVMAFSDGVEGDFCERCRGGE